MRYGITVTYMPVVFFMLSDAVPSVSTSVGDQFVRDAKGHWSTQSLFSRLNYIFNKKIPTRGQCKAGWLLKI